jgi:predicted metal-dependent phosphoesterase TrpH
MEQVVDWITSAGGSAVLAHPLRYKLTASWLNRVLAAFREAGGNAMEVVCGNHSADDTARCAMFASKHGLRASVGSDFHEPGRWVELGRLARLPAGQHAVWSDWT